MAIAFNAFGAGFAAVAATNINTAALPLTTTASNCVLIADVYMVALNSAGAARTVTGIAGTGTTGWTLKQSANNHGGPATSFNSYERWSATASNALTSLTITASFSGAVDTADIVVTAITGADLTTIFDVNANASKNANDTTFSQPQITGIATTNSHCYVIAGIGVPNNTSRDGCTINGTSVGIMVDIPNTFGTTTFAFQDISSGLITTAALSGSSALFTTGNPNSWIMLVDAIQEAGGTAFTWQDLGGDLDIPISLFKRDMKAHD